MKHVKVGCPSPSSPRQLELDSSCVISLKDTNTNRRPSYTATTQCSRQINTLAFTEDTLFANFQREIMSEVSFAKGFLATLDKRPIKLPADHVSDPRKGSGQSPMILPRQTHPCP